jgi:ribosomal protein S18 acetylase RimI-like enzyme
MLVAEGTDAICLVDIALLPPFRGRGIGRQLIAELLERGARAGQAVRLSVARGNRAMGLYRRLGFLEVADDDGGVHVTMEKPSDGAAIVPGTHP